MGRLLRRGRKIKPKGGLKAASLILQLVLSAGGCARLGVTRQTVIAVEQGRYSPSLEMAFQIAWVFGVSIDDVFSFDAHEKGSR